MTEEGGIIVGSKFIPCRRYVSEAKKIVISNCPPELSDDELKVHLEPYGRIVSTPNRLRVTTEHDDLKHIRSWRRSIFMMLPSEAPPLPPRLTLTTHDGVKHMLYIEKDEVFCTYCHAPGHREDRCKKKETMDQNFPSLRPRFQPPVSHRLFVHSATGLSPSAGERSSEIQQTRNTNSFMPIFNQESLITTQQPVQNPTPRKEDSITESTSKKEDSCQMEISEEKPISPIIEPHDQSISSLGSEDESSPSTFNFSSKETENQLSKNKKRVLSPEENDKEQNKFAKTNTSVNLTDAELSDSDTDHSVKSAPYEPVKSKKAKKKEEKQALALSQATEKIVFDDSKLSFYQFQEFLQNARGKSNSKIVAAKMNVDSSELIHKLDEAYIHCNDQNLSRRLQRASEALKIPDV